MGYMGSISSEVMAEWRAKSRSALYLTDPEAWLWDVLGKRWWSLQAEIAQSFVHNTYTLVKSCNGVGKTHLAGDLVSWFVSVHPPEDTSVVLSAPVATQINQMMFRYLRDNYQLALSREQPLIGEITKAPVWKVDHPTDKHIVVPKRPADNNLISSFQGIHDGYVAVILDEAGGLPEDLYIGANAVTTNKEAHIFGIGNPDKLHTPFHERFTDREKFKNWHLFTIGAKDTPNFTGEMIYPDDPMRDADIKGRLTQVEWADEMRRSARPSVIAPKVDGEFPDSDDTTFFDQSVINRAWETLIEPKSTDKRIFGVDISYQGEDKSVIYENHGGRIRMVKEWDRKDGTEHIESARNIHNLAVSRGATEVRIDMAGTGAGVYSNLKALEEFKDKPYILIGVNGANKTPNSNRWLNARAWHYEQFRIGMATGKIDIDLFDANLKKEMEMQPSKFTLRMQLQILGKDQMKSMGIKSPDHLDAAIYSYLDTSPWTEGPTAGRQVGDIVAMDPWELAMLTGAGLPI
jgi:hypothetical protein